jgi:predicted Zn finger-like uncharacterized protein
MLLATRCPFCETVFRLLPEQLTLRGGRVRCGHCREVFDASNSLFDVSNGTSLDKAKPITIDDVTAYTLGTIGSGAHAAQPEVKPAGEARPVPVVERVASAAPAPAAPVPAESETAHTEAAPAEAHAAVHVSRPDVEGGNEARPDTAAQPTPPVAQPSEAAAASIAGASVEAEAPAVKAESASVEPQRPAAETPGGPDFRAEAWNPWAPAPDASIEGSIRHNASSIPYNPVTIPRSAQPPLTLELTESTSLDEEKAVARKQAVQHDEAIGERMAEPSANVHPEPAIDTTATAKFAQPAGVQAHAKTEPSFDTTHGSALAQELNDLPPRDRRETGATSATASEPRHDAERGPRWDRDALHEPPGNTADQSALEDEDRTVTPSAHEREREPYFGTRSGEPDLEPRFGAAPRDTYGEPYDERAGEPYGAPFSGPFAATPGGGDDAFAVKREPRAPEPSRLVWHVLGGVAAGLLGFLLLVQLAWWQRETVMVAWPDSQPLFVKACSHLGCKIEPPRDIDGLLVEPSDLRQIDGPHRLELKMPLRNRFDIALAYPAVELTLLDENNNIAVRRVLWPQDYVKPGTPIAAGLPARTTQTMIVRLDTGDAVASNFRVQIFYP